MKVKEHLGIKNYEILNFNESLKDYDYDTIDSLKMNHLKIKGHYYFFCIGYTSEGNSKIYVTYKITDEIRNLLEEWLHSEMDFEYVDIDDIFKEWRNAKRAILIEHYGILDKHKFSYFNMG